MKVENCCQRPATSDQLELPAASFQQGAFTYAADSRQLTALADCWSLVAGR